MPRLSLFLLSIAAFTPLALPSSVTWRVTGHVTSISESRPDAITAITDIGGQASVGDSFSIIYTFDPTLTGNNTYPDSTTTARWGGCILGMEFDIGTWHYS